MSKPIKDYTLGEVKELCEKSRDVVCNCPLEAWCERYSSHAPECWDLSEPPRWTQEEVERAKALKVIWPEAMTLNRGEIIITIRPEHGAIFGNASLHVDKFPSLKPGETVKLEEIICGK